MMSISEDRTTIQDDRIGRSVSRAMDWVHNQLPRFAPFDATNLYSPARTKPFIELSIMLAVYVAITGDIASPPIESAARLIQDVSKRADFTDWIIRFPAELVNYAELCSAVDQLGGDAGELKHRLQLAVDVGALSQVERLPHRLLELRAALDWAGVAHSLPPIGEMCAQTILGNALSAPLLSDSSIYAITHVILFGSRFTLMRGDLPPWFRAEPVRSLLSDLLVVTSQSRNWDLLGELLLCWDCIGFEHNLVTAAGWASFLDSFRADGAVPPNGVGKKIEREAMLAEHADNETDFKHVYHTTLVAILAGTVSLNQSPV